MKRMYVTKKQVGNYIDEKIKEMGKTKFKLQLIITLFELRTYPEDNKNQIKFFNRVNETLKTI